MKFLLLFTALFYSNFIFGQWDGSDNCPFDTLCFPFIVEHGNIELNFIDNTKLNKLIPESIALADEIEKVTGNNPLEDHHKFIDRKNNYLILINKKNKEKELKRLKNIRVLSGDKGQDDIWIIVEGFSGPISKWTWGKEMKLTKH